MCLFLRGIACNSVLLIFECQAPSSVRNGGIRQMDCVVLSILLRTAQRSAVKSLLCRSATVVPFGARVLYEMFYLASYSGQLLRVYCVDQPLLFLSVHGCFMKCLPLRRRKKFFSA